MPLNDHEGVLMPREFAQITCPFADGAPLQRGSITSFDFEVSSINDVSSAIISC